MLSLAWQKWTTVPAEQLVRNKESLTSNISSEARLSLIESFIVLLRQQPYAIKIQLEKLGTCSSLVIEGKRIVGYHARKTPRTTWPVVEVVRHLRREVEVLTALALGGGREDHVPDSALVPLVQALIDLVHAPEGDGGHLLQGQHVDGRGDRHLPPGLTTSGQLRQLSLVPELDLDGDSVGLVVILLLPGGTTRH